MADEKQERPSGNSSMHDPLPYIFRLRVTVSEDLPSEVREFRVTAYSLMEGLMQAMFEASGSSVVDDAKVKVEHVTVDEQEYWRRVLGRLQSFGTEALNASKTPRRG
jgi:hypothetical protein